MKNIYSNIKINQEGFSVHILMILLLVGAIAVGTYLIGQKTNLLPKASVNDVNLVGAITVLDNNNQALQYKGDNTYETKSLNIKIKAADINSLAQ